MDFVNSKLLTTMNIDKSKLVFVLTRFLEIIAIGMKMHGFRFVRARKLSVFEVGDASYVSAHAAAKSWIECTLNGQSFPGSDKHLSMLHASMEHELEEVETQWLREIAMEQTSTDGRGICEHDPEKADVSKGNAKPPKYLKNWREILVCLDLKNNGEDRRYVIQMNRKYDGPIKLPDRGGQAMVEKTKLLEWWNHLEIKWETQGSGRNNEANVVEQYQHGKNEIVVPQIGGHVKKRRERGK